MDLNAFTSALTAAGFAPEAAHSPYSGVHAATVRKGGLSLFVRWYDPARWVITAPWSAVSVGPGEDHLVPFDADSPAAAVAGAVLEGRPMLIARLEAITSEAAEKPAETTTEQLEERLRPYLESWLSPLGASALERQTRYLVLDAIGTIHGHLRADAVSAAQLHAGGFVQSLRNAITRNELVGEGADLLWSLLHLVPERARPVRRAATPPEGA